MTTATVRRGGKGGRAPEHPVLRIVASPDQAQLGAAFPLTERTFLFGRSREADNRIGDHRMSRLHARFTPMPDGRYAVEDLETTNGTFLDGRRVYGRQALDGHVVSMGDTLMVIDRPPDRDAMPASPEADPTTVRSIFGWSLATGALRASVATVGTKPGPVLILGPTGVGKEVTARAVHEASGRPGEFVAVNCAAVPQELAESLFFGYYKGAFTGAERDQAGYFQTSSRGTLFLDEVGELPAPLQAKLLRVLEDQIVQPIGHGPSVKVDLRVVAATNAELETGDFRTDLLARLNEWVIRIPALSERKADVLALWRYFLEREAEGRARPSSAEFSEALLLYDWPQNARELHRFARRMDGLVGDAEEFQLQHLPKEFQAPLLPRFDDGDADDSCDVTQSGERPDVTAPALEPVGKPSREALEDILLGVRGNVKLAAKQNGWHRTTLYRWLKSYGIDPQQFR